MHNCCLVNLGDMLQNGTVISDTLIEKPHSFSTACNVATQVVAQIASNQYGGQSISLSHLAPFVDVSRRKIRKDVEEEIAACNGDVNSINSIVEKETERGNQAWRTDNSVPGTDIDDNEWSDPIYHCLYVSWRSRR